MVSSGCQAANHPQILLHEMFLFECCRPRTEASRVCVWQYADIKTRSHGYMDLELEERLFHSKSAHESPYLKGLACPRLGHITTDNLGSAGHIVRPSE